jgi:tetratricopeptide (TPR) repeat protein
LLCFTRGRNFGWKLSGLAVPVAMIAAYEWGTGRMYGHGLILLASHYARTNHFDFPGGWPAKTVVGTAFAGGSLLPLLLLAPWLWRRRIWLAANLLFFGLLLWFWLGGNPGLMHRWVAADDSLLKLWDFRLQVLLLTLGGLHVLLLAGAEAWQRRDRITVALVWWIGGVLFFTIVLNWTMNARSFLPAVPAVAILAVRRLSALTQAGGRWLFLPLGAAVLVALSLAIANWQLANSARTAAKKIAAKYLTADHSLWFDGHGGFQYYMEKFGGRPVDIEGSRLSPGDVVAAPLLGDFVVLPFGSVSPLNDVVVRLYSWVNLQGASTRTAAGFHTSDNGPIPFAVGAPQPQDYFVVKVFSRVQYESQPANPRQVLAGAVPSFPKAAYQSEDTPAVAENPAATEQLEAAGQLLMAGREAAAIPHLESALAIQSNNPAALSRFAWVLASASQPELRDYRRAVQLARQAVKLTDSRQPAMILILATAYAADGQFAKARFTAQMACDLAILTGQMDVADSSAKLIRKFSGTTMNEERPQAY